ncbi:MAG: AI-2E family transporter [Prolixibacteraceae bacterium]|nr:AI-2E family transporter [Prolixibacteraceae bacterium]
MKNTRLINTALFLFIASILVMFLILAKSVLIPLVIAMVFSYLMYPLVWKFEKMGVNRGISTLLVLLFVIIVIGGVSLLLSAKISDTNFDFTEMIEQFETKTNAFEYMLQTKVGIEASTIDEYLKRLSENVSTSWQSGIGNFFSATTTTIFQIGILPVFIFFLIYYRTKTAYFILRIAGKENRKKTLHILKEVSTITTKYLSGLLIVVTILAVLNSVGLLIIGVKHALVFGILAALLNLIPYAGTFLGGLIPFLYVFFTVPEPLEQMIKVVVLFMIIQFAENNLLTPNIVGNSIKINPLAIILSLLFANMIWGIAGMLIVVPILAIAKIIMRNIDSLKPYAFLISDRGTESHRIKFSRIFKRKKNK